MGAEFGNLAGRFLADVNGDGYDADKRADKDKRYQPRRNMTDAQRMIKRERTVHRHGCMEKDFRDPGDQDENENENVISFQPATDCF